MSTLSRTFLSPLEHWQKTSKTFTAPAEKSSDYNLGSYFTYDTQAYESLEEYTFDLSSRADCIGIYGTPTSAAEFDILTEGKTTRRTVKFEYPVAPRLHIIDIDSWHISEATRNTTKARLTDPKSMAALINQMLRNEGFDMFADTSKTIVLTSSQWGLNKLNCHLYFDFSEPVRVEAMREWTTALAKLHQRTVFDPAVYKAVQPDFITPPTCIGFIDPLKGKRIFYSPGSQEQINTKEFQQLINKTLTNADWSPNSTKDNLPSIGATWLHTISNYVGDERGVNEPAYRAAAQLVQETGRKHVLINMHSYAQQMHDEVWKTLIAKGCDRGQSAKDKQTYNIARFRQYLESATKKNFGDNVDTMVDQVYEAIEKAKEGDTMAFISAPVIKSLCTLKAKHKPHFIALKAVIKRSKIITLADLSDVMKSGHGALDTAGNNNQDFIFSADDGARAENELIDTVLSQYDMLSDNYGNKYASVPGNGDGGYRMMRVDGELVNVFYLDGLELSGNQVGPNFGKKAISKLLGMETKSTDSIFEDTFIGTRVISEDQTLGSPTWINLGRQTDGIFKSIKLKASGMELRTHQDSDVRWMYGVPPLYIAKEDELTERFGENADLTDYLISTLGKFINTSGSDNIKMIMWLCSVFSDKTLSYIIELTGPAATGKSTAADFLKDLTDPSNTPLGTGGDRTLLTQHNESNLIADLERRHVTILDNVSKLTPKLQDMLCSIATGLRHGERILYTQSQMERVVRRPLIITSIGRVITRDDLRSRVVNVEIEESEFNREFLKDWVKEKPYLVAAILQLTSKAMQLAQDVTEKPRGVGTRDVFLACVSSAISGHNEVDFRYVQEARMQDALELADDSEFVKLMSRWMDDVGKEEDKLSYSTRGLQKKLSIWVAGNVGKRIDGTNIHYNMVPQSSKGLGWSMSRYLDTLSRVTNWKFISREKGTNGIKYHWERKTLDMLENLL